jgi:RNA polymerase sigma factor (sigma-70 family)
MARDNEQAFTTLYNANKSLVLKMIVALNERKSHQTEDIMQDIFLTLWERRKKLVHIRSFECYLFIMVKNRLMTTQMKARARQKALQQIADRTDWLYNAVINDCIYRELYGVFCKTVDKLPPKARLAFELQAVEGRTMEEMATLMNISPRTAKNHLALAARRIKESLAKQ